MAIAISARPSRALHLIGAYVAVPLLLGWFAYVIATGAAAVTPQRFSLPSNSRYEPSMDDFAVFYSAGQMVANGRDDFYSLPAISAEEAHTASSNQAELLTLPFFSPPFAALPFALLSALPAHTAALIWTALGLSAAVVVALWLSRSQGAPLGFGLLFAVGAVASPPFFQVLIHGQTTFFLCAGFALLLRCSWAGRHTLGATAGLLLIADKPQLLPIPVAMLLIDRNWRPVVAAAGLAGTATLGVVLVDGVSVLSGYVRLSLEAMHWDDKNGISTWGMFGWNAFARDLLGPATEPKTVLTLLLDASTVGAVVAGRRRQALEAPNAFAAVVFASLLISPHVYEHDVLLTALPVFLLCTTGQRVSHGWCAFALAGWVILYFHFDILSATGVNATALWLACGLTLALFAGAAPSKVSGARRPQNWMARAVRI